MIQIREAVESDVDQIREIFLATYGEQYAYPQFYNQQALKKMVFSDDALLLVAEDSESGRLFGTASVLLEMGAYADLVGEFGRLVVHPDARRQGIAQRLMEHRVRHVQDRLHLGIVEARALHPYSQKIAVANDFAAVGFSPLKLLMRERESVALFARYFGGALSLRRNHPRIIPEVDHLAELALVNCGLKVDAIVDEEAGPYPYNANFQLDEFTTEGYASLLRFQRGRFQKREIFGPMRLHYGLFKIMAQQSQYLLARQGENLVGGIGFTWDKLERAVRIFELISLGDEPVRFLLTELERKCREAWEVDYIELDVSAYAPAMQRTLLELNFLPIAYVPAMVFHEVERLDAIKMARLLVPPRFGEVQLVPQTEPLAQVVLREFARRDIVPRIAEAAGRLSLFVGLNREQTNEVASICTLAEFHAGDLIAQEGESGDRIQLVLVGQVAVTIEGADEPVGMIGPDECLGELCMLSAEPHSATVRAKTEVETAALTHHDLNELIRRRPDIGVVIYRNLAAGLGHKLRRTDASLTGRGPVAANS